MNFVNIFSLFVSTGQTATPSLYTVGRSSRKSQREDENRRGTRNHCDEATTIIGRWLVGFQFEDFMLVLLCFTASHDLCFPILGSHYLTGQRHGAPTLSWVFIGKGLSVYVQARPPHNKKSTQERLAIATQQAIKAITAVPPTLTSAVPAATTGSSVDPGPSVVAGTAVVVVVVVVVVETDGSAVVSSGYITRVASARPSKSDTRVVR